MVELFTRGERTVEILEAINKHIAERGFPPSIRELGGQVGLTSTSTVQKHIERLCEMGWCHRVSGSPRTLTITKEGFAVLQSLEGSREDVIKEVVDHFGKV